MTVKIYIVSETYLRTEYSFKPQSDFSGVAAMHDVLVEYADPWYAGKYYGYTMTLEDWAMLCMRTPRSADFIKDRRNVMFAYIKIEEEA